MKNENNHDPVGAICAMLTIVGVCWAFAWAIVHILHEFFASTHP